MAIIDRVGRLFRADVHAVLDRLEEPEVLLRQSIREMEEALAAAAARLATTERELASAQRRGAELRAAIEKTAAELDLAFDAGNEALQRTLLKRRLEHEKLAAQIAQRADALAQNATSQREKLAAQQRDLEALRQKAELFETAAPGEAPREAVVTDADVELALLRERRARGAS
jgi:phage shock protein A